MSYSIDADFPGGNICLERFSEEEIILRQELRDTTTWWFHWAFRARGCAGKTIRFVFRDGNVMGSRGPALSLDDGASWSWLGLDACVVNDGGCEFLFAFPEDAQDVLFAVAPLYTEKNLREFLANHPEITEETLTVSRGGRNVPLLRLPRPSNPCCRVFMTARHHACECMASFALEGFMEQAMSLSLPAEILLVPLVDRDGVENGDQGKNRAPHDHNRDYNAQPLYPEVAAIQELVGAFPADLPLLSFDMHCPWIRGFPWNEIVYQVGKENRENEEKQLHLADCLRLVSQGEIPQEDENVLRFGTSWNTAQNYSAGKSNPAWMIEQPNVQLATSFEIPYANASNAVVLPGSARDFGRDLASALKKYLVDRLAG